MAVYILIEKASETDSEAEYDYFPEGQKTRSGRLLIRRAGEHLMAQPLVRAVAPVGDAWH
jgi:hypothetical protein